MRTKFILCLALGISALGYKTANAQTADVSSITRSLDNYKENVLQEKIFLHSDRDSYLVGESMWFKIYNVDGNSHKPTKVSKVAYVEVLDREQNPVLQAKVALKGGIGSGSFVLPPTLNSGNYLVRAYTNWMKNFSADLFFEKPVTIVNTFKPLGQKQGFASSAYDVQFFPEGGHLVNGVRSVVAFKAANAKGNGVHFAGVLLNQENDTLAQFDTHKFGIGRFTFTPVAGHKYRAKLKGAEGQIITRELPVAQDKGYVMEVTPADADHLTVTVRTNPLAPVPGFHTLYLLAHTRKAATLAETAHPDEAGKVVFTIAKDKLGDGITYFTVFNGDKQPVCERLYFKKPEQLLHISPQTEQKKYSTRSEVNLEISLRADGADTPANLSVAVFKLDSLQAWQQQSMVSYLWLTSELKGTVEEPEYYFSQNGTAAELAQDNLMLTHGWSKFNWSNILSDQPKAFSFAPEYGGHMVTGRVLDAKTKKAAPGIQAYLASPSRNIRFYTSVSDKDGRLLFDVMNFFDKQTLVLQTNSNTDSTHTLEIDSPFSPTRSSYRLPDLELSEKQEPVLLASSIHMQVQNYHANQLAYKYTLPAFDSTAIYGTPDKSYRLDDYTR